MTLESIKQRFLNLRRWELNPVVVKELRQAVRNWSVTGMLLLFLVVLFGASLIYLVGQSFRIHASQQIGRDLFQAFMAILTVASFIFIPLYVGVRLAWERQENNLDLLYISTLTPGRIIRGKFFCGVYMALLFFSACMPFMAFTILLRGVDLPTIFFILFCLFGVVCLAIQAAILLACLPVSRPFKILLGLGALAAAVSFTFALVFGLFQMMHFGVGTTIGTPAFWKEFLATLASGLAILGMLYMLSVALISPASANRALPLRVYLSVIWLLGGAVAFYSMMAKRSGVPLEVWLGPAIAAMLVSLVFVVSNHDQLSYRVRRAIPAHPLKRALAFLFFNGAAGGLLWIFLLTGITVGTVFYIFNWGQVWFPGYRFLDARRALEFTTTTSTILCYAFAYALLALFIHRRFLASRPPKIAGVLAILLPGIWAIGPNLVLFFFNRLSWDALDERQLGNIFNILIISDDVGKMQHLAFSFGFLLLMMLINVPWFFQQVRSFQPLEKKAPKPEPVAAAPAPAPAAISISE